MTWAPGIPTLFTIHSTMGPSNNVAIKQRGEKRPVMLEESPAEKEEEDDDDGDGDHLETTIPCWTIRTSDLIKFYPLDVDLQTWLDGCEVTFGC